MTRFAEPPAWLGGLPQWPVPLAPADPVEGLTLPVPLWSALDSDAFRWIAVTAHRLSPHGLRPAQAHELAYFAVLTSVWEDLRDGADLPADAASWTAAVRAWDAARAVDWEEALPRLTHRARLTDVRPRLGHDFGRYWTLGHNARWISRLSQTELLLLQGRAHAFARLDPHAAALPELLGRSLRPVMRLPSSTVETFVGGVREAAAHDLDVLAPLWAPVTPPWRPAAAELTVARCTDRAVARAEHLAYWMRSVADRPGVDDRAAFATAWSKVNRHALRVLGDRAYAAAGQDFLRRQPEGRLLELYADASAMTPAGVPELRLPGASELRDALAVHVPVERRAEVDTAIARAAGRVWSLSPETCRYVLATRRSRRGTDREASYRSPEPLTAPDGSTVENLVEAARSRTGAMLPEQRMRQALSRSRQAGQAFYGRLRGS